MLLLLQQLINGLSIGAIYALIAVGYTLVYGVLRLINFAHGDVLMIGAMIGLYSFNSWYIVGQPSIRECPTPLLVIAIGAVAIAAGNLLLGFISPGRRNQSKITAGLQLAVAVAVLALCPLARFSGRPVQPIQAGAKSAELAVAEKKGIEISIDPGDATETEAQPMARTGDIKDSSLKIGWFRFMATRWAGSVDYGDGAGPQPLAIDQKYQELKLAHVYATDRAEPYAVQIVIQDNLGQSASRTLLLKVKRQPSWAGLIVVSAVAMTLCALLGAFIERVAYRPLRNRPRIDSLITAIGVSMLLEFGGQSNYAFGPTPRAFPSILPHLESTPVLWTIHFASGEVRIGRADALILAVTLFLMAALWYLVMKTRTGMALRAVSHRFDTAALMGINVDRIVSFTFMLGSALAAIAAVLVGLRSPQVDPLMGINWGLKAFVAAVLGGIGSIPGAVAGGILLGITESMVAGYLHNGSQYRDGVAFIILIAVLLVKPSGLFGKHAIEKV